MSGGTSKHARINVIIMVPSKKRSRKFKRMVAGKLEDGMRPSKTAVYINGRLIGFHDDGDSLVAELRAKRRAGEINPEVNFALNRATAITSLMSFTPLSTAENETNSAFV